MGRKLTLDESLALQDVLKIGGDLLLLPEQVPIPYEAARTKEAQGHTAILRDDPHYGIRRLMTLNQRYQIERACQGREPRWVRKEPISARRYFRVEYAIQSIDPLAMVFSLPHTGISYLVKDYGLCDALEREFNLKRLQRVRQLGFLTQPIYNQMDASVSSLGEHDRWLHSLDVMALGTVIGNNLRLNRAQFNTLRTMCFTHDALTPAGGDSVKLVDPDLDEDKNYPEFLKSVDTKMLRNRFKIGKRELLRGIRNQGVLGTILDIADKLAYVGRDLQRCMHHIEAGAYQHQPGFDTMMQLLERYPYICGIWEAVELQRGDPVFTNMYRLAAFLKMRVLLFRELYYNPTTRFGEFLMSRLFVKALYRRGVLTKQWLLEHEDSSLIALIHQHFGTGAVLDQCSSDLARCETFETPAEGEAFMRDLRERGILFAMMDDNRRAIKTGLHFKIWTKDGPASFGEAYPEAAQEIAEMAIQRPMVHVYYLAGDPRLDVNVLNELKRELA